MNEKNVGISQQTLVSNTEDVPAKKLPQYIASLSSTLGALTVGMVLGWTAVAGADGKELIDIYNINITSTDFSWIGSLTTLGAAAICIPIGILADLIGRKYTMLLMVIPLTLGWLLLIFANSLAMFFIGRLSLGFSVGAVCVTVPMYVAEIAESGIRGRLGSFFQLLLAVGSSFTYVLASFVNMRELSIISAVVPFIFFGIFMFMPETPIYYLKKGNEEALLSILLFSIMFSIGFGPLPWTMMGEIFAPEIKGVAASGACVLNWLLAFVVTKFFDDLKQAINMGPTFWLFSAVSAIGTLFVYIFVLM